MTEPDTALMTSVLAASSIAWFQPSAATTGTAAWFVWDTDRVWVLADAGHAAGQAATSDEQKLPDLTGAVLIHARSKETGAGLLQVQAQGSRLDPRSEGGAKALTALKAARLNASTEQQAQDAWLDAVAVFELIPEAMETLDSSRSADPQLEAPRRGSTTTQDWQPFHLTKRPVRRIFQRLRGSK